MEMHPDRTAPLQLRAMFEGAKRFGLSEDEAWRALDDALVDVGRDASVSEYLEELARALARRILCKQRRNASEGEGVTSEELT